MRVTTFAKSMGEPIAKAVQKVKEMMPAVQSLGAIIDALFIRK